ncbi:ribokinase [Capsaspora owczarzaki ATCC 30864]|uniref:Ribokinase n=1 Tax=Capsaspora owczarzaki (strain ATCC 30864) TaxID=595528 RepID=A0A0D2X1C2_CAPO3|nr:ribokinase [Capsaspora owczarzaki ATCC 30864]KJE90554.1 ribokinase [Capsaspora owczarzaki ATCC 30864]|eukprot:XP_004364725.1 ribokinase [Capsaspora owczarzaki ATCC 30864]
MTFEVVVCGSSNMDLIAYVDRMPAVGETIHGHTFASGFGGKGANQCVMAGKLGAKVAMITKVGEDAYGTATLENYKKVGVNTDFVFKTSEASTGVAPITVDAKGNNSIIIIPGANALITPEEVSAPAVKQAIETAAVLVTQNEINHDATLEAMRIARHSKTLCIYNPAPALPSLPEEFLVLPDIVCLNETEAALYTQVPAINDVEDARQACKKLLARGARSVLLTMGATGSLYVGKGDQLHNERNDNAEIVDIFVRAQKVDAVDSSGAGDSFVGALAYYLAHYGASMSLKTAINRASSIASDSVRRKGTQSSYPTRDTLPSSLFDADAEMKL